MGFPGTPELIIILLVVLLVFGGAKLPKLARSMGEASKEFKKGLHDGEESANAAPAAPAAATSTAADEPITMTKAELERLLAAEREAQTRKDVPPTA
jgi:sec-independent protein translocase protein TatA